jgi:hypothetical protein
VLCHFRWIRTRQRDLSLRDSRGEFCSNAQTLAVKVSLNADWLNKRSGQRCPAIFFPPGNLSFLALNKLWCACIVWICPVFFFLAASVFEEMTRNTVVRSAQAAGAFPLTCGFTLPMMCPARGAKRTEAGDIPNRLFSVETGSSGPPGVPLKPPVTASFTKGINPFIIPLLYYTLHSSSVPFIRDTARRTCIQAYRIVSVASFNLSES